MAARALGLPGLVPHSAAAVIEFIHTATLLRDDVVDESDLPARSRRPATPPRNASSVWSRFPDTRRASAR